MNPSSLSKVLDDEAMRKVAEKAFALDEGLDEIAFPLRRRGGLADFYERLEREVREHPWIQVEDYRGVKEGFVRISRPSKLKIDRARFCREFPHLASLAREIHAWRERFGREIVDALLRSSFADAVKDVALTLSCLEVFKFLLENRESVRGLMPRQIPHAQSTKLIRHEPLLLKIFSLWRSEPGWWTDFFRTFDLCERAVDFRFYAPACRYDGAPLADLHALLSLDWWDRYDFTGLSGTLIVENFETFLAEAARPEGRLIIWGCGWRAALLKGLHRAFPRPLWYWGDMDKDGYEIYGHLKGEVTDLRAVLMDAATLSRYRPLAVRKERFFGPFRFVPDLQAEYELVCREGLCIEQEKIHSGLGEAPPEPKREERVVENDDSPF